MELERMQDLMWTVAIHIQIRGILDGSHRKARPVAHREPSQIRKAVLQPSEHVDTLGRFRRSLQCISKLRVTQHRVCSSPTLGMFCTMMIQATLLIFQGRTVKGSLTKFPDESRHMFLATVHLSIDQRMAWHYRPLTRCHPHLHQVAPPLWKGRHHRQRRTSRILWHSLSCSPLTRTV